MIHVYDMASGERLDEKPENQDQVTAQEYALVVAPRLAEYFEEEPVTAEQKKKWFIKSN